MGLNERREKEKQIRRNDIIDAAERVFFSKGYDATTVDDIAKEAEFSKRTIYVYFNSKEQIYFEVMVRGYRILIKKIQEHIDRHKDTDALEQIKGIGRVVYEFSFTYPGYFKAIMEYENGELDFVNGLPNMSMQECYALGEDVFNYLVAALKKGIGEGVVKNDIDVLSTAIILWASIVGIFSTFNRKRNYIWRYHGKKTEELIEEAFDLLINSIKK